MKYRKCPKCGNRKLRKTAATTISGKPIWACRNGTRRGYCYRTTDPDRAVRKPGSGDPAERQVIPKRKLTGERFVVTWAQNATPVHAGFFKALLAYCRHNDAELIVIPGRYKNPTSQWTMSQDNAERWAPELAPYLFAQRRNLNSNITLIGDIKIQPTRQQPLTGKEGFTHTESGIFGHPKLSMRVVPTPQNRMPKIMTTTGAVTEANYTDTDAGKMGEFHHVLGAVVVEIANNKIFHMRHVNYSTKYGAFIDLDRVYNSDGKTRKAPPYEAIVFGDAHYRFADPEVVEATFSKLCKRLRPKKLVWHDLLDGYSVSPHHQGNPFIAYAKLQSGFDDARDEVDSTIDWMAKFGRGYENFIVPSNHDDMLKRWVIREDWKRDPVNAEFYLETALNMLRSTRMSETGTETLDPFQMIVESRDGLGSVTCVPINGSLVIAGIECSLHGDKGPNGARGSIKNLRRIGPKVIIGHSHTPGIDEGAYQTGTLTRSEAEYTGPVGSWLNTHCSIDAFGKSHLQAWVAGAFWL